MRIITPQVVLESVVHKVGVLPEAVELMELVDKQEDTQVIKEVLQDQVGIHKALQVPMVVASDKPLTKVDSEVLIKQHVVHGIPVRMVVLVAAVARECVPTTRHLVAVAEVTPVVVALVVVLVLEAVAVVFIPEPMYPKD